MPIWTPPKWDWVDPLKEAKAVREEIAGGLSSLSEKLRARGENPFANDVVPRAGGTTVDIGSLRDRAASARGEDGKYAPGVLLDLDLWALCPR